MVFTIMNQCKHLADKYQHILDKGQDMKMEELKMLFERGVPFETIKKALNIGHIALARITDDYGIERLKKPRGENK